MTKLADKIEKLVRSNENDMTIKELSRKLRVGMKRIVDEVNGDHRFNLNVAIGVSGGGYAELDLADQTVGTFD